MGRYSGKTCRLSVMLSLTFSFFLVEIVVGYMTSSVALVADSFHMLSDVVALVVAFFCMKISKRRSSSKNTFGWVRAEVLGALINAVFLIALCFSIFVEALSRLIKTEPIHDVERILIVGIIGLAVNILGIFMFHGHASVHGHSHARPVPLNLAANGANGVSANMADDDPRTSMDKSAINGRAIGEETIMISDGGIRKATHEDYDDYDEDAAGAHELSPVMNEAHNISIFNTAGSESEKRNSMDQPHNNNNSAGSSTRRTKASAGAQLNMHGVFLHILGDALGSIIVIINALVCWKVDNKLLREYLDPSLSLVMALIILSTTIPLFKESAMILLQTVPTHINVEEIKRKLLRSIDGVLAVHEFHVWRLAGNKIIATAHIRCRNLEDYMKIAESVKQLFHDEGIHSTTIQPEFDEEPSAPPNYEHCVLECPREAECAPSMCCSASGTRLAIVTSDGTVAASAGPGQTLEIRPVNDPSKDDGVIIVCNTGSSNSSPPGTVGESGTSSSASEDDRYKGIPPILYYNKGYNQLSDTTTSSA